jgi:hypothetical protein
MTCKYAHKHTAAQIARPHAMTASMSSAQVAHNMSSVQDSFDPTPDSVTSRITLSAAALTCHPSAEPSSRNALVTSNKSGTANLLKRHTHAASPGTICYTSLEPPVTTCLQSLNPPNPSAASHTPEPCAALLLAGIARPEPSSTREGLHS